VSSAPALKKRASVPRRLRWVLLGALVVAALALSVLESGNTSDRNTHGEPAYASVANDWTSKGLERPAIGEASRAQSKLDPPVRRPNTLAEAR
jgi:hypothetical protein